ncbi:hypothetical protein [Massilia litorea]|uniref:hypothetical protein n=1 Tax=Massilia litorea TaxID=2769491 RepID=UPI001D0D5772|nr:hypothetical protein [Massilia litorea]
MIQAAAPELDLGWFRTLPKTRVDVGFETYSPNFAFAIADSGTGKTDVVFEGRKLPDLSNEVTLVKNSFINTDRQDRLTSGYAVSRQLQHASSKEKEAVTLRLGEGSLSAYIKALKLGKMLKYEYVPDFQSALYAPAPLALASEGK